MNVSYIVSGYDGKSVAFTLDDFIDEWLDYNSFNESFNCDWTSFVEYVEMMEYPVPKDVSKFVDENFPPFED